MEELLSIREAAKLLGVTEKTLREWDHSGKLRPQRTIGGHRRYSLQDIRKSTAEKSFFDSFNERDRTQNYRDIQTIHKYWESKLPNELRQDCSLSALLENYMILNTLTDDIGVPSEDMVSLVIATWGKMKMRQFISTQAALGPASLVFCANESEKGVKIDSSPIMAQTMKMESCRYCKSLQIKDNLEFYSTMLAAEMDKIIVNKILEMVPKKKTRNFKDYDYIICGNDIVLSYLEQHHQMISLAEPEKYNYLNLVGRINDTKVYKTDLLSVTLDPESFMPQYSIIAGVRRKFSDSITPSDKFIFCPYIFLQPAIDVASFSSWVTRIGFYYPPEPHPDFEVFCYEN